MTTIATDMRVTVENAKRIRFEPISGITATNVQDAIGSTVVPAPTVVAVTGAIPTSAVNVQTNQSAPITLTLPDAAAWAAANGRYGVPLSIFDASGTASTNNVTINRAGSDTIDGLTSLTIASDYGGFRLQPKTGGWIVV